MFIALDTGENDPQIMQCLTTEVMQWTETILIMNLTRFYSYWKNQSLKARIHPLSLWRKIFNHLLGEEAGESHPNIISISSSYSACCARNPWTAVLLLYALKERGGKGLISRNSKFGRSLFEEISWKAWWQAISILEEHLLTSKIKRGNQATFKKQCHRLKLAAVRLGFKRPGNMDILNRTGVKKRFGTLMADIWNWTYGEFPREIQTIHQTGFPWKTKQFVEPPFVRRYLDYPLSLWEQFTPLLIEDLDKLCSTGQRVVKLDWDIKLENMPELHIPICFRNPHDLKSEEGEHRTTLLQAGYGFKSVMEKKFPPPTNPGDIYSMPPILGWELKISASLSLPNIVLDIFGNAGEKDSDLDILLRLENELPVRLSRFAAQSDWLPEDSYLKKDLNAEEVSLTDSELDRSLEAVAENRPLYIRHSPMPIEEFNGKTGSKFLESTMNKWWRADNTTDIERDYFKHIDPEGNSFWIFRDTSGHWYQHGIFG